MQMDEQGKGITIVLPCLGSCRIMHSTIYSL